MKFRHATFFEEGLRMFRKSRLIRWWMFLPYLLPVVWFAWLNLGDRLNYDLFPSPDGYDESLKRAPWFESTYFSVFGLLSFAQIPSMLAYSMLCEIGINPYAGSRLLLLPVVLVSPTLYSGVLWLFHWNWLEGREHLRDDAPAPLVEGELA